MASQQGHENPGPSSSESPADQGQPQQIPRIELEDTSNSTGTPARTKGKKKVGFVGNKEGDGSGSGDHNTSERNTPGEGYDGPGRDYFSSPGNDDQGYVPTPPGLTQPGNRESFNKDELTAMISAILKPEHHGGPSRPRPPPALRKHARVGSDIEMTTPPHRSELEARNRADRLAHAVGNSSVPPSGRSSLDRFESGTQTPFDGDSLLPNPQKPKGLISGLRSRKRAHQTAKDLVRTHTGRLNPKGESSAGLISGSRSGTATPVPEDIEYVPRPEKYQGGILGSLLKLYNAESKKDGMDSSFLTTPRGTPNRTPSSTPPTSRPGTPQPGSSGPSRPKLRPRPHSSSTLAGLMESAMVMAAPGNSKDISDAVSDKLKAESQKAPKKRSRSRHKEEYRITIHIAEIINRHRYLVKLCRALMMYGAPTHRLENYMKMSARVLGIEGQFMYLPNIMMISFDDSNTHTTEMKIVRSPPGVDLGRLRDVHEIYKEVVHDQIGVEEATQRLEEVLSRQPKFPKWVRLLLYGLASASVSPFGFQGRFIDMPMCLVLGCLVGWLQLYLAPSNELYANVFEITAAVATSCLARALGSIHDGKLFCFSTLAQSSIALILPGYMVLSASLELQSHQMIAGSVRMVYALIYSLFLGYGITIGSVIYGYWDEKAVSEVTCSVGDAWYLQKPPPNTYLLFVFPFTLCLCVINQAKWKQTPVMVVISLAGFCANHFSARRFQGSSTLSSTLGALCVGVLANLYARMGRNIKNFCLDKWELIIEPRVSRLKRGFKKWRRNRSDGQQSTTNAKNGDVDGDSDAGETNDDGEGEFIRRRRGAPVPAGKDTEEVEEEYLDLESGLKGAGAATTRRVRQIGFGLAAAAMLPAIFVQVPSGLAVGGSLLSGVQNADKIVRNVTVLANGTTISSAATAEVGPGDLSNTAFNVLSSVIQVAISISVGLSLSALIVYPFGKRRSGLLSL